MTSNLHVAFAIAWIVEAMIAVRYRWPARFYVIGIVNSQIWLATT